MKLKYLLWGGLALGMIMIAVGIVLLLPQPQSLDLTLQEFYSSYANHLNEYFEEGTYYEGVEAQEIANEYGYDKYNNVKSVYLSNDYALVEYKDYAKEKKMQSSFEQVAVYYQEVFFNKKICSFKKEVEYFYYEDWYLTNNLIYANNNTIVISDEEAGAENIFLIYSTQKIGAYAFSKNSDTLLHVITNYGLKTVGSYAFLNSVNVSDFYLVDTIDQLDLCALNGINTFNINATNQHYKAVENVLYSFDEKVLYSFPASKNIESYEVLTSVEKVEPYAFYKSAFLRNLVLPDGVEEIGVWAFYKSSLRNITIGEGVQDLPYMSFAETAYGINLTLPSSLKTIHETAFFKTLIMGINFTNGNDKFSINGGMLIDEVNSCLIKAIQKTPKEYSIPQDVKSINPYAFQTLFDLSLFLNTHISDLGMTSGNTIRYQEIYIQNASLASNAQIVLPNPQKVYIKTGINYNPQDFLNERYQLNGKIEKYGIEFDEWVRVSYV